MREDHGVTERVGVNADGNEVADAGGHVDLLKGGLAEGLGQALLEQAELLVAVGEGQADIPGQVDHAADGLVTGGHAGAVDVAGDFEGHRPAARNGEEVIVVTGELNENGATAAIADGQDGGERIGSRQNQRHEQEGQN